MANIGDKVRIKVQRNGLDKPIYFEGIVNGRYKSFGRWEYVVTELKGIGDLKVRKLKVIHG